MVKIIEELDTTYYIGRNAKDNTELFDQMDSEFYWFHPNNEPGCHVYIAKLDPEKHEIIRAAQLSKEYSKKYDSKSGICYIQKKFLKKDKTPGTVILLKEPKIIKV